MHRILPSSTRRAGPVLMWFGLLAVACGGSDQTIDATDNDGSDEIVTGSTSTTTATEIDLPGLATARSTWGELGLANYTYTFTRACECPDDQRGPFRVIVVDGRVDRVEWFGTEVDQQARTVPEIYAAIETRPVEDSRSRPRSTSSPDTRSRFCSTSRPWQWTAVKPSPSPRSAPLTCSSLISNRLGLDGKRHGITDYEFPYQVQCFCPRPFAGSPFEMVRWSTSFDLGEEFEGWPGLTVDNLFETLQEAIAAPAFSIDVSYDEGYGFPASYYIDEEQNMADEEHGIVVTRFTPLS